MYWKSFIIVKYVKLWNYISSFYNIVKQCTDIYYYNLQYYHGNNKWIFIKGHILPLSLHNVYNKVSYTWLYNNYNNTLSQTNTESKPYKFSWLSATINIKDSIYEIDTFIEKLSINTDNTLPSLYVIFMCWCVYTKNWFEIDNIEFRVINDNGEEMILALDYSLTIKNNKIY